MRLVFGAFVLIGMMAAAGARADDCDEALSADLTAMEQISERIGPLFEEVNGFHDQRQNRPLTIAEIKTYRPKEIELCGATSQLHLIYKNLVATLSAPVCAKSSERSGIPTLQNSLDNKFPESLKVRCNPR